MSKMIFSNNKLPAHTPDVMNKFNSCSEPAFEFSPVTSHCLSVISCHKEMAALTETASHGTSLNTI